MSWATRGSIAAVLLVGASACREAPRPDAAPAPATATTLRPEWVNAWGGASLILAARIEVTPRAEMELIPGGDYTVRFVARVEESFRGGPPPHERLGLAVSSPAFLGAQGKCVLLGLRERQGASTEGRSFLEVVAHDFCSEPTRAAVSELSGAPLGWSVREGRWRSPWATAATGKEPWPSLPLARVRCAATGRPGWLLPPGVTLTLQPRPQRSTRFALALTNNDDEPRAAPALVTRGGVVAWEESLLVAVADGALQPLVASKPERPAGTVRLGPKQMLVHEVDVAPLLRERLGSRPNAVSNVSVTFALGDRSVSAEVYYGTAVATGQELAPTP